MGKNEFEVKEEEMPEELVEQLEQLLEHDVQKGPFFYEEGVCDVFYVPIDDGELRVFHHKPNNPVTKRPILFIPGFSTSPKNWRDFAQPFLNKGEFYFLETREKKSSKIKRRFKTKMRVKQTAKDIGDVIKYLKLNEIDFVLECASYCGGVQLRGLIEKYYTAPTIVNFDPLGRWAFLSKAAKLLYIIPPALLGILRLIFAKIFTLGMKNKDQKERIMDLVKGAQSWKFRKGVVNNLDFNVIEDLEKIDEEVFVFHGPMDRYHPHAVYENIARGIPNGRYFFMLTENRKRELLAGTIGFEFCKVAAEDKIPDTLKPFEIKLER